MFSRAKRPYQIKKRAYIEALYLRKLGFEEGTPIKFIYNQASNSAVIIPVSQSENHVALTTQKTGKQVPVIDIGGEKVAEFFANNPDVEVEVLQGKIIFSVKAEVKKDNVIDLEEKREERLANTKIHYSVSVSEFAKAANAEQMSIFDAFRVSKQDTKKGMGEKLREKAIKMLSLFSGCGSMDKGFLDEGFDIVFANDRYETKALKDYHIQTYKKNIGEHIIMKDVLDLTEKDIPQVDFLAAGIPCVKFSALNTKDNYRDSNSDTHPLVEQTINIVKWSKAKAFLFENVANFITVKKGAMVKRLKEALPNFNIVTQVIDATRLGSVQKRVRSFVFGIQGAIPEISLPHIAAHTTVGEAFANIEGASQQDMRFKPTEKTLERMKHIPQGGNIKDCPEHLRAPNKTFSNYCQRLDPNSHAPTITHVQDDVFIHPDMNNHRYLSVRETARLFSLPDEFEFIGSLTAIFEMLKNAVDYKVSKFLAKTIKQQLHSVMTNPVMV